VTEREPTRTAGRPPVAGVARSVRVEVRCTPDERERWEAAAASRGVTLSELVRLLLERG